MPAHEVFKRINLAGSEVERKQAMELMSDLSGFSLSEQEFTEFIPLRVQERPGQRKTFLAVC